MHAIACLPKLEERKRYPVNLPSSQFLKRNMVRLRRHMPIPVHCLHAISPTPWVV